MMLRKSILFCCMCVCLFGCGKQKEELITAESPVTVTTVESSGGGISNDFNEAETVSEPIYKFGQDDTEYIGTAKEVFGLYADTEYINLVDCNFKDLMWLFQSAGIELPVSYLREKVESKGSILFDLFNDEIGYVGAVSLYNDKEKDCLAKDCNIELLLLQPSCLTGIKGFDGSVDIGGIDDNYIKSYLAGYNLVGVGESREDIKIYEEIGIEYFPSLTYSVDGIGSIRFDYIDGEIQPGWSVSR